MFQHRGRSNSFAAEMERESAGRVKAADSGPRLVNPFYSLTFQTEPDGERCLKVSGSPEESY